MLERIAGARIKIDQARVLTLKAADMMVVWATRRRGRKIAMIKVVAPNMAQSIVDGLSRPSAAGAQATITSSRRRSERRGCCDSPTGPTRCTATRSASSNCVGGSTRTRRAPADGPNRCRLRNPRIGSAAAFWCARRYRE